MIPDSFKGSATASEVAEAMAAGVRRAAAVLDVEVHIQTLPFADGGEGTLDAICSAWGVQPRTAEVTDALGRAARGRYAVSEPNATGHRIGVIEAAEANGLPQVSDVPPRPLEATTYGVGALVTAALDAGAEEILLCIGGSATTDGGAGLAQALGARLLDEHGHDLGPGGAALAQLHRIDLAGLDPRSLKVRWRIACDVTNPLLGPEGAAAVFGPQKGADEDDVAVLDAALTRLVDVLTSQTGRDVRREPGTGAAGGMPVVLMSLFDAEILPGGALVAETLEARRLSETADLVLTGEGRLDQQSLHGKVVDTVRSITPRRTPLVVLAGSVDITPDQQREAGITAAFSIAPGPQTLAELQARAAERVAEAAEQIFTVYLAGRSRTVLHPPIR
ncbi:glycerate kinase [Nesterenkonia flava]